MPGHERIMPIYEYQCDGCNEVFEVYQRHTDPPPAAHTCGSTRLQRVLSNTSFVLKGTGWYATDYATQKPSGDKADAAKAAAPADKAEGASSGDMAGGGAADPKPAAKAEGQGARKSDAGGAGSRGGSAAS